MALCALALGWLVRQVLIQDRPVEAQRRREEMENIADRTTAAMERALLNDHVDVTVTPEGAASITPPGRLSYVPTEPAPSASIPDR
jgi:hypothetical protein